ncbi:MAG: hypothetical protein ACO4AH_08840 [Burkholderiaceae bacterium]
MGGDARALAGVEVAAIGPATAAALAAVPHDKVSPRPRSYTRSAM